MKQSWCTVGCFCFVFFVMVRDCCKKGFWHAHKHSHTSKLLFPTFLITVANNYRHTFFLSLLALLALRHFRTQALANAFAQPYFWAHIRREGQTERFGAVGFFVLLCFFRPPHTHANANMLVPCTLEQRAIKQGCSRRCCTFPCAYFWTSVLCCANMYYGFYVTWVALGSFLFLNMSGLHRCSHVVRARVCVCVSMWVYERRKCSGP